MDKTNELRTSNADTTLNSKKDSFFLSILYVFLPPLWLTAFLGLPIYGKRFKNKLTSVFNSYVLPPIAVICVFLYIFYLNDIYPFGEKTIAWCDMTQQGVPYWINFKQVLQGDHNLFLNMANAAGMDGWTMLRSYFLYPFSYLILFVDTADVMAFVSLATVFKFAACCLTAMIFFRTCIKKLHPSIAVALSMMYSFCAYGIMYSQILNWPNAMYIMPLYFTGLYLLLKENKIWLFSVSIALVMRNFAFGYMAVIATLLFVGYYFIVCEDKLAVKKNSYSFTVGSAAGALLSMPLWLQFFSAFCNSARGVNVSSSLSSSVDFTSKYTVFPLVMSTAFMFVAAFLYKATKKKPIEKAIYFLFGIMLIPMVFEPINKMWHFGSYMGFPARYAYMLIFAGLAIAGILLSKDEYITNSYSVEESDSKTRKCAMYLVSMTAICCGLYFLYDFVIKYIEKNGKTMAAYATTLWGNEKSYKQMFVLFALFLLTYTIVYAIYKRKLISKQLFAFALIAILVCEAYASVSTYVVPSTAKMKMQNYYKYMDMAERVEEDDEFFRVKNARFLNAAYGSVSEANFPGTLGYNSMGHYSSLTSESYLYAVKAFGYSSVWMKIDTYGGTKFSDALFSIKYNIDKSANKPDNIVYQNDMYCIAKNENYLPLGIFADGSMLNVDLEKYSRIGLQESVFKSITESNKDLFKYFSPTYFSNCKLTESKDKYSITTSSSSAYMQYDIKIDGTKTLYFDCFDEFSNSLSEKVYDSFSVYVNGVKKSSKYPVNTQNGLLNLGTFTNQDVTVKINVLKNLNCRSFGVYAMDDDLLEKELNAVDSANLSVVGNKISGSFTSDSDGFIFVSVPYNQGFKCKVNGKSTNIENIFGGFIGVPVSKGENKIVLSYTPSMFVPSMIVWGVSIVGIIALAIILKKKKINGVYEATVKLVGEKNAATLSSATYICCLIAFLAVLLLVYVYPIILAMQI